MPMVFFPSDADVRDSPDRPGFPEALGWPGRQPEPAVASTYVRLQRALKEATFSDHNDRIVTRKDTQEEPVESAPCDQLRDFFAWLYAQRRSAIYASNLSERIYHIWLPGGLLSPAANGPNSVGPLVMLPLVTLVRRPNQLAWRHTIGVTIIFVPVQHEQDGRLSPRALICDDSREAEFLTRSLEGGSTGMRPYGKSVLVLEDCPFKEYVSAMMGTGRYPSVMPEMRSIRNSWAAAPRQWIELCTAMAADGVGQWDSTANLHQRRLSDAVLRSLRSTAIWSVAAMGEGLDRLRIGMACCGRSRPATGARRR